MHLTMNHIQPSRRELEILRKLCEGLTAKEIANHLHISPGTVETHKRNLLLKMNAKNTVDLAVRAVRLGIC